MVKMRYFDCKLAVSGEGKALTDFEVKIPSDGYDYNFSFDAFIPMPKEFVDCAGDVDCVTKRYEWRIANWSTPADATEGQNVNIGRNSINILFGTLVNPPEQFVRRLSWRFPTLDILLSYETDGERGYMLYKKGQLVKDRIRKNIP